MGVATRHERHARRRCNDAPISRHEQRLCELDEQVDGDTSAAKHDPNRHSVDSSFLLTFSGALLHSPRDHFPGSHYSLCYLHNFPEASLNIWRNSGMIVSTLRLAFPFEHSVASQVQVLPEIAHLIVVIAVVTAPVALMLILTFGPRCVIDNVLSRDGWMWHCLRSDVAEAHIVSVWQDQRGFFVWRLYAQLDQICSDWR